MRYNEHTCMVCGETFEYCRKCAVKPIKHFAEGFCSEAHSDIFNILAKHGSNLATAEETLTALADYDTTDVNESIKAHIDSLQPKKVEEKKAVETTSKKFGFRTQE